MNNDFPPDILMPPTPEEAKLYKQEIPHRQATHEAGHVVLSRLLGVRCRLVTLKSMWVDGEYKGAPIMIPMPMDVPLSAYNQFVENDCIILAGGVAAEELLPGTYVKKTAGGATDEDDVRSGWPKKYPKDLVKDYNPPANFLRLNFEKDVTWEKCCMEAKSLLSNYDWLIRELADEILAKTTIYSDEIDRFFESRGFPKIQS